jgi:hypothetical protein
VTGSPLIAAPARADVPPGRSPTRGGWGVVAIIGVILVVVLGGYVAAAALSEPVGPPVEIPGVLSVHPLSGWVFAGRGTFDGFVTWR